MPHNRTQTTSHVPDSLRAWMSHYQQVAVNGIRSEAVTRKIAFHLNRFVEAFEQAYGHDRISTCVKQDVSTWQKQLQTQGLAPATVNNYLASLSAFATWVHTQTPTAFPVGDPTKGVGELTLPPLEPRALSEAQIRTLKNLCARLEQYYRLTGRQWAQKSGNQIFPPMRVNARPKRDKAIILVLLSTGLRREELVGLNIAHLVPAESELLRTARRAKLKGVRGKGKTERDVFLSADARTALADYLELERAQDVDDILSVEAQPLFLTASGVQPRRVNGRLSPRSINLIVAQIGRWHDAELDMREKERAISPLRPHDLRHTFAFQLAKATGADAYELERRLGHRSQRYIQRYTNPPEQVAAGYIETF